MSDLRIEQWTLIAAVLGSENPLPPLRAARDAHTISGDDSIPIEMLQNMAYGHLPSILPYTMQDGYSRDLKPTLTRVAVLENDFLRAAFLLEYGARLWSLIHKPSGRELVGVNPTIQLANLALRNAWFAGGVEWNIGTIGHSPFTCASLFAARLNRPDGTPVLRLYEWERIRQVAFQIDAFLPDESPVLYVAVRICNPRDQTVPMYWWTNIAVPETAETRVIAPAESVYHFDYKQGQLQSVALPADEDFTYPTRIRHSADYFFHISDDEMPFIAAVDGEGKGLVQASTRRLRGRKLFLWGMGSGGRRWQGWLSPVGQPYIEIQAGLARTQMEHLPMPARTNWSWLEAYGMIDAGASAHSLHWPDAWRSTSRAASSLIDPARLQVTLESHEAVFDQPPIEVIQHGSGWGALEQRRLTASGERPIASGGLIFDERSMTDEQALWLTLLEERHFTAGSTGSGSSSFMVQDEWRSMLEAAASQDRADWLGWLHLGVMRWYAGNIEGAGNAWERSLHLRQTATAYRNLAILASQHGDQANAVAFYISALEMQPDLLPLAVECGQALIAAGCAHQWLELAAHLPDPVRAAERIRLLEAAASLQVENPEPAQRFFAESTVPPDLREGETVLSDLWMAAHQDAAPEVFDFRMQTD